MKQILIILIFSIPFFSDLYSQDQKSINKASSIMDAYWQESDDEKLSEVESLLDDIFEDESAIESSKALFVKAQFMTAQLMQEDFEADDINAFLEELNTTYEMALRKDHRQSNRHSILTKLYTAKAQMSQLGADHYVESEYSEALNYYNSATDLNNLEIEFPRMAVPDSSIIYTNAVVAQLAEDNDRAIELFQKLVDMEYNREDIYDYLIRLYEKGDYNVKAKKTEILKKKRFPSDK